jgi:peptidoglycan/LPS O-acetylase OafA/YrhL
MMHTGTQSQPKQASVLRPDIRATAGSPKAQRIPALDFTKGALVLIMVLYHWINYFIGPEWKYYPYLRFLTPSFIFITGFMISHVYLSKYAAADPRLWKRLFTRGLKLMTIFLVLNLARSVAVPLIGTRVAMQNLPSLSDLFTVFVSGNLPVAGTKIVSFSILIPISYLLMFSGVLMLPFSRFKYTIHFTCLFLLLCSAMLKASNAGSYNLEFITIGMMGVLSGFLPIRKVDDFIGHRYVFAFAYLCYTIAITLWNVPFPLLIVGVLLNLMAIYAVGAGGSETGAIRNEVILLGKYSLLGYISQVAILQILSAGFQRTNLGFAALPVSFFAAFALTIMCVEVVDRGRARSARVDRLYKTVFA